jgi:hypothetical protein
MKKIALLLLSFLFLNQAHAANSDILTGVAETTAPTAISDGQPVAINLNAYGKVRSAVGKTCTKVIDAVQLDNSPTSVTSSAVNVTDAGEISVMATVAETDPGGTVDPQATISVNVSPDDSTYLPTFDILYDGGGTDAPVSAITKNPGNGATLYEWSYLPKEFPVNYVKVQIECSATVGGAATCDADELLIVNAWVCYT